MPGSALDGLVGRDSQMTLLQQLLSELLSGRGRAVWLEGEPGIGKSALLAASLTGADDLGCHVIWAAADEVGGRFPLRMLLYGLR
jgi:predicted ATP-dependent serine protease